jgi:acyl dehydratase
MTVTGGDVFQTNTGISDEEVAEVRAMIGEPLRVPEPFNVEATVDTIRHFAHGYGDDNPLYCDESYGAASRFGSVVAPPTFLYSVFAPGIGPGFGGLQGFHAGGRWEFRRPIRPGDRVRASAALAELQDKQGRRSGRLLIQIGEAVYTDADGNVVGTNTSRLFRLPRRGSEGGLEVKAPTTSVLTADELEELEAEVLAYRRRGAVPRYWDDTQEGDAMEPRVKGPLELNDIIAFSVGIGNVVGSELSVKRRHFARTHPDVVANTRPLGWLTERVPPGQGHMDPKVAEAVGMPSVYDNGWLRVCWMGQFCTDWMGDDAALKLLDVKLFLPNLVGDVLRLNGRVARRFRDGNDACVELDIAATRQDGEVSCSGSAIVVLPGRPGPEVS